MSAVRDDIASRLDAEQQAIEAEGGQLQAKHADDLRAEAERHQAAVDDIDRAYGEGLAPLRGRAQEVEAIRAFLSSTGAAADPQTPSAPSGDATTSATDDEPEQPSEQPTPATPQDAPSTPTPEPEPTPSTESGEPSPDPQPTATEPITVTPYGQAENVDLSLPVAVPLTTGQTKVVTAGDVIAAQNADLEDDALTTTQLHLRRNSDWP